MSGRLLLRLHLPAAALAALCTLLALQAGGFHARTFGWACLALVAWAGVQAARGRLAALRSAAGAATTAMLLLTCWTVLSITWAQVSRHDAWEEGVRTLLYAAAFILGTSLLASARSFDRFARWAGIGCACVGLYTAGRLAWGDAPLKLFVGGRLDGPIGYANGTAALHWIGALLLVGASVSIERRVIARKIGVAEAGMAWGAAGAVRAGADKPDTRLLWPSLAAGLCVGGAALEAMLATLAQSRGSLPALLVATVVLLSVAPARGAIAARLAMVGAAVLVARPALGEVFQRNFDLVQAPFTAGADVETELVRTIDAARDAGIVALVVAAITAAVGVLVVPCAWQLARRARPQVRGTVHRAVLPVAGVAVIMAAGALLATGAGDGSPIGWARDQVKACTNPPSEPVKGPGSSRSHFSNTGTGRCDYYRVALVGLRQEPLAGVGAANFHGLYIRERRTGEQPRVAHSLPLQLLSELGIVGAALGSVVLGAVLLAGWGYVRGGARRDVGMAGAIAAITYWGVHGSVDWLWQLPGVSVPIVVLAGGLVACASPPQGRIPAAAAAPMAAGVLLAAIALVLPLTMADRALRQARDPELRDRDPAAALAAAQDAARFDPTWAEPWIVQGGLHYAAGRRREAGQAGREAILREPRDWSVQHRASGLVALVDREGGAEAARAARRLNPRLAGELERQREAERANAANANSRGNG